MISLSKSQNFLSPNVNTEKRKVLLRSACSFSIVEDNIIAPTPTRKLASVPSSPVQKRREKRSKPAQESLFGEAGEEIQTILFPSVEELPVQRVASPKRLDFSMPMSHFTQEQPYHESEPKDIAKLSRAAILAMEPMENPSPPLRASNPITMNSVFHADEPTNAATSALREEKKKSLNLPDGRNIKEAKNINIKASKEKEMRFRSASWPALSNLITSN